MSIFILKIIALASMIIDHSAYLHLDYSNNFYYLLRHLGRIAFPLYLFILTESLYYTKNRVKFLKELLLLAFISQIPFYVYFGNNLSKLNVIFTLFFGSFIVYNIDNNRNKLKDKTSLLQNIHIFYPILPKEENIKLGLNRLVMYMSFLIPIFFDMDYSFTGAYFIVILYYLKKLSNNNNYISSVFIFAMILFYYYDLSVTYIIFGTTSSILILFYNKKEGKKFKRLFQISYPLHITIFIFINYMLLRIPN